MLESFFNKVARVLSYDPLWNFQEHLFSRITPQNQTTLLRKQIRKVT